MFTKVSLICSEFSTKMITLKFLVISVWLSKNYCKIFMKLLENYLNFFQELYQNTSEIRQFFSRSTLIS